MTNWKRGDLTPWFDGHTKPIRLGVYMLESGGPNKAEGFQHWDGQTWGPWYQTAERAAQPRRDIDRADLRYQNDRWRGLKRQPRIAP